MITTRMICIPFPLNPAMSEPTKYAQAAFI